MSHAHNHTIHRHHHHYGWDNANTPVLTVVPGKRLSLKSSMPPAASLVLVLLQPMSLLWISIKSIR